MKRFLAILLSSTLICSVDASAITLKEALQAAYETNPEIMASRARLAVVDESYNQAASQNDLTLDLDGFYGASRRTSSTIFSNRTLQDEDIGGELGLTLTKPLYQGGRVKALKKQSKADIEAARQTLRTVQQRIFLETTTAYIDAVFDEEVLSLQQKHSGILTEMENLVTTREEIGVGTETDIWRIKSRASAIEGDITRAETSLDVSRTVFEQVTGRKARDMNWGQSLSAPTSLEAALQLARNNNPSLFEALSREASADAAIDVAKSAFKPTVAVVGNSFITDDRIGNLDDDFDIDGVTVGLNLRMPLLGTGGTKSRVRVAKHELATRQFETALVQRSIKSAVEQAWTQYRGARTVRESIKRRMDNADKTYRNIEIEFELGTRTIFDVVEAEQDYLNSQVEYLQSRRDAEQAAALLLASMGMTDTIPHIQQTAPSGVNQVAEPAYAALTKSDSPFELQRSVSIRPTVPAAPQIRKIVPENKAQVFRSQLRSDAPSELSRRLRTRAVPKTMQVPAIVKPQAPKIVSKAQVFSSVLRSDAPSDLGRQLIAAKTPTPVPSRAQIFSSLVKSDAPNELGRKIGTAQSQPHSQPAPRKVPITKAQIFRSVMATDAPVTLRRLIPVAVAPQPVYVRAPAIKFRHSLD